MNVMSHPTFVIEIARRCGGKYKKFTFRSTLESKVRQLYTIIKVDSGRKRLKDANGRILHSYSSCKKS